MARNTRVIHCTVDQLEEQLNTVEGAWQPICWNFYPDGAVQRAVVVLARIVQQIPMAAPPGFRIHRQ